MHARPLTDEEIATVEGWLRFQRTVTVMHRERCRWWQSAKRKVYGLRLATLDSLLRSLHSSRPVDPAFAEQVVERARVED